MASTWLRNLLRTSSLLRPSSASASSFRPILLLGRPSLSSSKHLLLGNPANTSWSFRNLSFGSVNFVLSEGKPKFETHEVDPPKKEKWKNKKRFKLQKKREKQKRKAANKKDPRRVGKKRKQKFANAEEKIKYKLEKARMKETLLIEKLKKYEVPKVQGPVVKPDYLTGEERFFLKKMGQKKSNYAPVGRRGVFGGVILNMHMHWKKHETVKVICKPCKPGQVHDYAQEIARLSGGIPIQIIGDETIIFYRGRNYVQPEIMSPIDTLSKKRALEKSKYEQSLESVRRFIAIAEKELELYYRHTALYGDPNSRNPIAILEGPVQGTMGSKEVESLEKERQCATDDSLSRDYSPLESDFSDLSETESEDGSEDDMSIGESAAEYGHTHDISNERVGNFSGVGGHPSHDLVRSSSADSSKFGNHDKLIGKTECMKS